MFYHCRELKYVKYDKVYPPSEEKADDFLISAYKWLGKHCGFCPQIWLSRSRSSITGYRTRSYTVKNRKRRFLPKHDDIVMFGFENVKGFPIDYEHWEWLINVLCNESKNQDKALINYLDEILLDVIEDAEAGEELNGVLLNWKRSTDLNDFLKRFVFVENDQVVVPSLNLKSAKQIFCRNEKQKKISSRSSGGQPSRNCSF